MNGYPYSVFGRHLLSDQIRTGGQGVVAVRFRTSGFRGRVPDPERATAVLMVLAASLVVVGLVLAAVLFAGASGDPGATEQVVRIHCTRAPGLWSGCLPSK